MSRKDKDVVMNNLTHIIDIGLLKQAYLRLDGKKAIGIDGVTKEEYGKKLEGNLQSLLEKIHGLKYRAKPSRQILIPKEDGSKRILSIGCIEDKIVQGAVHLILEAIYEPIFSNNSYGFRPGRNCHDALRALNQQSYQIWDGMLIDMDIEKCFNSIPHQEMMKVIGKKISDKKFKRLIARILKSPTSENGKVKMTEIGCPQGNILSPMLANIYLHEVLDSWFENLKGTHLKYKAELIRVILGKEEPVTIDLCIQAVETVSLINSKK